MNDKRAIAHRGHEAGGVLITALVFAVVISLFVAGVATISVGHLSRGSVESDYATAIQLADAGINHELRWLSIDASSPSRAHQQYPATGQPGPYTATVPGIPGGGSFTVSVTRVDGSGPWAPPQNLLIRSTGTVNGISRTVEITGQKRGIFDDYAIYAITEGKLAGSGSIVNGNVGTNGPVYFSGGGSTTNIQGEITYNGYPRTDPIVSPPPSNSGFVNAPNVWWNPDRVNWPTVAEIADALFPGGLSYLASNNNNANVLRFDPTDLEFTVEKGIVTGITTGNLRNSDLSGFTVDGNIQDAPPLGTRWQDGDVGLFGKKVIIFPPGEYYFNNLSLGNSSTEGILIDNAKGMVRIWVSGGTRPFDSLDTTIVFTSPDKNKFRLYYNNCSRISMVGNSTMNGSIYAYSESCARDTLPEVDIGGGSVVNGAVIAPYVNLHGNAAINFPNNGGGAAEDDYVLWYGFKNTWREIKVGKTLFPDGTTR